MLTFTYECRSCNHALTVEQRITDEPLEDCPKCSRPALQRLITSATFLLKGDGWAADGYTKGDK